MSIKQCLNCGEPCTEDFCCDKCEEEYFDGENDDEQEDE